MYKTPQSEDEQSDYIPQRRKRPAVPPRRLQMEHGPDEHPEIPKIRRASRYLDQEATHSPSKPEEVEEEIDVEEREHIPRARPPKQETSKISVVRRHRSYVSPVYTPPPRAHHTRPHTRPKRSLKEQAIHI